MMRQNADVLIADDEPLAREVLETHLDKIPGFTLAGKCQNAFEAFRMLNQQHVDILLLDINMPEINGIDFLKTLKKPPLVIFTTAYSEFAVESYELNAVDYLLKPVSFERFIKAMNKASQLLKPEPTPSPAGNPEEKLLFVRSDGKWIKINISKLLFIEALKDYVRLFTEDGRITVHSTMKNFEEQLSSYRNFVRVHKSHIVNMDFIHEISGSTLKVRDHTINIGSTYKEEVSKILGDYRFI